MNRMRQFSSLPIAVGFGISNAEQVADVSRYADAVVVGSAIVAEMERFTDARLRSWRESVIGSF